jgi:hypothetical protein
LENKKYRFFGRSPLPMKGRERSSLRFANRVQQKCIYFPQYQHQKIKKQIILKTPSLGQTKQ